MFKQRVVSRMLLLGMMTLAACVASGQNYPTKPIRIVAGSAGGAADFAARIFAQELSGPLGQPVVVNNQNRVEPGEVVAKAQPDGYTLLLGGSVTWLAALMRDMPFNVLSDFSPITLATTQPLVLVVHPSVAASSVKELIALAKAKPGVLNYGAGGLGASAHLATELFRSMAGINIVRITYQGTGPALNAVIAGEVQLLMSNAGPALPFVKSGRLKALAVTSAEPSALVPGLPTVAASGLPGYESGNASALFAPAKTPEAIIKRLNQEVLRVLNRPDVKEKFFSTGVEVVGSSPEELTRMIKSEMARIGKVIKEGGIRTE
jgi:tripartite-type tricarboxylate transporter receptor subunit TctC